MQDRTVSDLSNLDFLLNVTRPIAVRVLLSTMYNLCGYAWCSGVTFILVAAIAPNFFLSDSSKAFLNGFHSFFHRKRKREWWWYIVLSISTLKSPTRANYYCRHPNPLMIYKGCNKYLLAIRGWKSRSSVRKVLLIKVMKDHHLFY